MNARCPLLSLAAALAVGLPGARALSAEPASPAPAKPGIGELLDWSQLSHQTGEWAEYARTEGGKIDYRDTFRLGFVAAADDKGPWAEVWMGKTGQVAMRFRKVGEVTEAFFQMGGAIYRIDDPHVTEKIACAAGGSCGAKGDKPDPNKTVVGQETIATPAGTFKCTKVRARSSQGESVLWTAAEVPAMRLARVVTPLGYGYELVAFGKNATSAFPAHFIANPLPLQHMKAVEAIAPELRRMASPVADGGVAASGSDAGAARPIPFYQGRDGGRE